MARLHIANPEGELIVALGNQFTIGRQAENSLALTNDRAVSREHARIERVAEHFLLHDLKSANGTFVERGEHKSRVTEPVQLQAGDVIHVGRTRIVFDAFDGVDQQTGGDATIVPGSTVVGRVLPVPRDAAR
jgi:pSer/pThr/pTyr-binding forkhead associated (FHA) protein